MIGSGKIVAIALIIVVLYWLSWLVIIVTPLYYIYKVTEDKKHNALVKDIIEEILKED